jgi:glutamate 5-kinase
VRIHIANGRTPDVLSRIVEHKESIGTTILPYRQHKGIKRWLAHTHPYALPSITINECITEIFLKREKTVSLLPVGIVSANDKFEKGDLVAIRTLDKQTIGIGIAAYDSLTLESVLGKKDQKLFMHYNKIYIYEHPVDENDHAE